ncbi:MAG: response regulator [Alphaproteobacteria bacterium]|nr:response regulator [Alphaproteobacteria bacterium]
MKTPVPWQSSDELGQVVRSYNEMQEKEAAAEEEVKKYQENLENLVRERTAELSDARDEAQAATLAKATFLATMSHEIRTPMNGVVGMIDLLRETRLNEDQLEMVGTIRESAYSLLTIINDILDFSKVEAGKLELEEVPISVRDIVEGVSETLAPNARGKGIGFSAYVDPEIPDVLIGDQTRLRQILFNLAGNAVKFTATGKVIIRADRVPSESAKAATVRFRIIDTGIGIPEEAQKTLFQAFSQVDASTTRKFGGTGLGLSICVKLSELMGGKIGVESEPDKGSTFEILVKLPIGEEGAFPGDGQDLKGVRVLSAVRDNDVRDLFAGYLGHWGAEVASSADIGELEATALDAASQGNPFDVVVLGSGWEPDRQSQLIKSFQGEKKLARTGFTVMRRDRRKSEREALENTVYVDSGPLRRGPFLKAVAAAAGRASPEIEYSDEMPVETKTKAPTVEEAEARGELILLAEDNLTNQNVIRRQMNMLGFAVEIADDGVKALELLRSRSFAVLFTDCHMPNMDGFELTEVIRKGQAEGQPRFPIIAITASVLKEEVDHCFGSGMDDFLPKPLEMAKLKEMLAKWMPKTSRVPETVETAEAPAGTEPSSHEIPDDEAGPIDPKALKDVFGDDEETFREILVDFVDPSRAVVSDMEKALGERTAAEIGAAAHKLKSSSRSVGAYELAGLCEALEMAGKSENWEIIDEIAPQVGPAMDKVADYIENL